MAVESNIPTVDVLPPMSSKARDLLYGVLAWAAGLLTIVSAVILVVPEWDLERPLVIANIVVNGLWTLGGFKAKKNVTPDGWVEPYEGQHEAGESALHILALVVLVLVAVYLVLAIA